MNQVIDKLIKQIARLRTEVEMLQEARKDAQKEYEHTPEFKKYAEMGVRLSLKDAELADLERMVKQDAVKIYCDVTNTEVGIHPAIGIRQVRKLEYDSGDALVFCRTNLMAAIKLDTKLFEKHAKAVEETAPLPFVTYSLEVQATLATDLSNYLGD
jgi:hypothetical protein